MEKDWFTKSDFPALEAFYRTAYDRLSEEGKDAMSERVWGGVRAGEYQFIGLPADVKEKEAGQIEHSLRGKKKQGHQWHEVPVEDREEFLRARDAGQRQQSYEILNRPVFSAHAPELSHSTPRSASISPSAALEAEGEKANPVHAPEAALLDGSLKLELQDNPSLKEGAADLQPPLSKQAAAAAPVVRRP